MRKLFIFLTALFIFVSCGKKNQEIKPEYRDITETVFASGILEPNDKYNLTSQSDGYLVTLNFKESDIVKAGDVLAVVDNKQNVFNDKSAAELLGISQINVTPNAPALKQTEVNIILATEKVKQDEQQAARYKKLLETNSVSKLEFENMVLALENSKTNLASLQQTLKLQQQQAQQQLISQEAQKNINSFWSGNNEIKAIAGGKVYNKMKEVGDYVRKGDVIAVIGKENDLYARVNVDESNIAKIISGQRAIIQLNTRKDVNYNGTLFEILPAFEDETQSFICKIKFDTLPVQRIAGTQLQANVIIGSKKQAFVIPRDYLDFGNKVFIKGKEGLTEIKTGFISNDWVEVISGLSKEDILLPVIK